MAQAFQFAVLNDLHYLAAEDGPWLEGLVREVNGLPGVELVLVLGDLAEDGKREELEAAKGILDGLRVPYYVVPGNHDGTPGRAINGATPGLEEYERLYPGRRNYWFGHGGGGGWQFLGLDTTNGSGWKELPIPAETMAYARRVAGQLDGRVPTILFTHMPLDPAVKFSSSMGYELLGILRPLNLRIVFCGHYHGHSESVAPPPSPPHLKLLTSACCSRVRELHDGSTARGYMVCEARADETVGHRFVEYKGA